MRTPTVESAWFADVAALQDFWTACDESLVEAAELRAARDGAWGPWEAHLRRVGADLVHAGRAVDTWYEDFVRRWVRVAQRLIVLCASDSDRLTAALTVQHFFVARSARLVDEEFSEAARKRDREKQARGMQMSNRLKSEFLANLSHELRTPLNAIIGFSSLLYEGTLGPLQDQQKEYIGDVVTSAQQLLQLIDNVIALATVEAGRMEFKVEDVELGKLVHEVKDILRGVAAEKHIRITVTIDPSLPTVVLDARMLKQVLYNYLSNAIKFTSEGGKISVRVDAQPRETFRIEVQDTGVGIEPEDVDRLFIEFQRLDAVGTKQPPGTGLGLALTKRIVEAQGGQVGVASKLGEGSTFSAVLPVRGISDSARGASSPQAQR